MSAYRPRRAARKFLDGDCPSGVLAIFDNGGTAKRGGTFDRYTVFYTRVETNHRGEDWVWYRGMSESPSSPQGFGVAADMTAYEMRRYRDRCYHHSTPWSSLPDEVKAVVRRDSAANNDRALIKVDNGYVCGRESTRYVEVMPPFPEVETWWDGVVFPETGDGHGCGARENSWHEATLLFVPENVPRETGLHALVGTSREW